MPSYAGVGSRETPPEILSVMEWAAVALSDMGWTLRSGHAPGADMAFEVAAAAHSVEVYLPWPTFQSQVQVNADFVLDHPKAEAYTLAASIHPNWSSLKRGAQALHARNSHQLLGRDLNDPAKFVLCWTERGLEVGGTGQAMRLAKAHDVPVFNLAHGQTMWRVERMIEHYRAETEPGYV